MLSSAGVKEHKLGFGTLYNFPTHAAPLAIVILELSGILVIGLYKPYDIHGIILLFCMYIFFCDALLLVDIQIYEPVYFHNVLVGQRAIFCHSIRALVIIQL